MESYAEAFDYGFSQYKEEMYNEIPKEYSQYMREESTTRPYEKRGYLSGLGLPKRNRDGQPLPWSEPIKGPNAIFVPVTYRLAYQIDRQSVEDELWGLLASRPKSMLYGSVIIKDLVASDILNNGLTAQTYDLAKAGQVSTPLFGTAHLREDGGGTWSNLINTAQPITAETVFTAVSSLLTLLSDSRGLPIAYTGPVNIYVPMSNPDLWEQAVSVVNSVFNPDTADNRINAVKQVFSLNVVPLRYLTNPDVWFVGWAPGSGNYGLTLLNRVEPEISPLKPFGDNEDVWYSRLRMRFTAGYENRRGIGAIGA